MGNAVSFRLNPKNENDKKILAGNIAKVIKKYKVDINIKSNNKIRQYASFPPEKKVETK